MPVDPIKKRKLWTYTNDFNVSIGVILSVEHGTEGAFALGDVSNPPAGNNFEMRRIHGVSEDGLRRTSLPVGSLGSAGTILASGNFTWDGDIFLITGYTGESFSIAPPSS